MNSNTIKSILAWFVQLFEDTKVLILSQETAEERIEMYEDSLALFHRKLNMRIQLNFWS